MTADLTRRRHHQLAPAVPWKKPGPARAADDLLPSPTQIKAADRRISAVPWLTRHPAWPVTALLVGYPMWWALGVADFAWIVLAIPMASRMLAWRKHHTGRLKLPAGMAPGCCFCCGPWPVYP